MAFVNFIIRFLSDFLGGTKTIRPFTLNGHGKIAYSASPSGLLTLARRTTGLFVNYHKQLFTAEEFKLNQINIP